MSYKIQTGLVQAVKSIQLHEGLRLKPYLCTAGKCTIGYGRNLDDVGFYEDEKAIEKRFLLTGTISQEEAEQLLFKDIDVAIDGLTGPKFQWFWALDSNRFAAIVDMVFNLGITRFMKFKNTIKALETGDYDTAAVEMLDSKWAKQVKIRARRLAFVIRTGRRFNEYDGLS